jgi:hypothetical protein
MKFEWDTNKEKSNIQKHGITFELRAFYHSSRPDNTSIFHSKPKKLLLSLMLVKRSGMDDKMLLD